MSNDCDSDSEEIIYNDDNSSLNPDNSFNETSVYKANESVNQKHDEPVYNSTFNKEESDDDEIIENDANDNIQNKMTINLPTRVSKGEFDVGKNQNELTNISPSPIKKKITIDDQSINVELKNNNEFIDMEHFDEASKIGFGLLDEEINNRKVEVLTKAKVNKGKEDKEIESSLMKYTKNKEKLKEVKEEEDIPYKESPYKQLMKKYVQNPIIDFAFLRINNQMLLQKELQNTRTYNKFLNRKIQHYYRSDNPNNDQDNTIKNDNNKNMNKNKAKGKNNPYKLKRHLNPKSKQNKQNDPFDNINRVKDTNSPSNDNNELDNELLSGNNHFSHNKFNTLNAETTTPIKNDDIKNRRLIKENNALRNKLSELNAILCKLQEEGDIIDQELQKKNEKLTFYLDKYDSFTQENQALKAKEENKQVDYSIEKNESQKKSNKIIELQTQYDIKDEEHQSMLKKQEMESIIQKETKKSLETYKGNYTEMRSQYDLINIKYQSISDENFNFKRDVLLYEKELKNKSDMINKLRNNLLESAKFSLNNDLNNDIINTMESNDNTRLNKFFQKEKDKIRNRGNNRSLDRDEVNSLQIETVNTNSNTNESNKEKKFQEVKDKSLERIKALSKKEQVKQIETKISKISQERDHINSYLNKLPEHLRKKDLIDKRTEMETKIEQLNSQLGKWRIELKALKINDKYQLN